MGRPIVACRKGFPEERGDGVPWVRSSPTEGECGGHPSTKTLQPYPRIRVKRSLDVKWDFFMFRDSLLDFTLLYIGLTSWGAAVALGRRLERLSKTRLLELRTPGGLAGIDQLMKAAAEIPLGFDIPLGSTVNAIIGSDEFFVTQPGTAATGIPLDIREILPTLLSGVLRSLLNPLRILESAGTRSGEQTSLLSEEFTSGIHLIIVCAHLSAGIDLACALKSAQHQDGHEKHGMKAKEEATTHCRRVVVVHDRKLDPTPPTPRD